MAELLKGSAAANAMLRKLNEETAALSGRGVYPALATIRVGNKGDDAAYERSIIRSCEKAGIKIAAHVLPETASQSELLDVVGSLNQDVATHGILIFRPLPRHISDEAVRKALSPRKDVDGITDISMAGIYSGREQGFAPCTAEACIRLLDHYGYEITGKQAVIVGRSLVIGKPVAMLLIKRDATVTVCHTKTRDLVDVCRRADIIVACAGRTGIINQDHVKPGQVIIDVGINLGADGAVHGDVDFESVEPIVQAITPVPGGVGSVTTAVLLEHTVRAVKSACGLA